MCSESSAEEAPSFHCVLRLFAEPSVLQPPPGSPSPSCNLQLIFATAVSRVSAQQVAGWGKSFSSV